MVRHNIGPNIQQEKSIVQAMIALYCRKKHRKNGNKLLCHTCVDLQHYALSRLTFCRFGEEKTTCELCPKHCYRQDYKKQIKQVMRFSGPRMIIYHPLIAIRHIINTLIYKRELKNHDKNN